MRLSNQALGAIMLALQNSIMEQSDIVPILKGFCFKPSNEEELIVENPPTAKIPQEFVSNFEDEASDAEV